MYHGCLSGFDNTGLSMGQECWKGRVVYIEVFAVKMSKNSQGGSSYQVRELVYNLDVHVTQGGLCYRVLGRRGGALLRAN